MRDATAVIRQARRAGCVPQFYVLNEAGAQLLAPAAGVDELSGVIVSQVTSHPGTVSVPAVAEYLLAGAAPPSYLAMEGFLYARVITGRCAAAAVSPAAAPLWSRWKASLWARAATACSAPFRPARLAIRRMTIVTPDGRFRR